MSEAIATPERRAGATRTKFGNLPALPEITFKILSLSKDPSATPAELQRLICSDIALSTRILKVVNSAFYGLSRKIGTIDRAVVVLGRNAVRNIAVAASMVKIFSAGGRSDAGGIHARDLWMHSTAAATAAKLISEELNLPDANELFLAGLTHDIGIMAEMHWSREKLLYCVSGIELADDGSPLQDLRLEEQRLFGVDHQELGQEVCDYWNFPSIISEIAGHHHDPLELPTGNRCLVSVIAVADRMASSLPGAFRLDLQSLEIPDEVLDVVRLSRTQLTVISERLTVELDEVTQMLS